jgi:hypothetical protein
MPRPEGVSADESAKWVSDEKPPRNPQAEWENPINLQNREDAMRNPPDSCKDTDTEKKVWTGVQCLENEPNTGKKPQ